MTVSVKIGLEESTIFTGLPPGVLARIRAIARDERFPHGATIFSEGDLPRNLYILTEGAVELSCVMHGPSPMTIRLSRITPGEAFGWSALLLGERLTADARTLADSGAYAIPAERLIQVLDEEPAAGYLVMKRLSQLIAKRLQSTRSELRWIQAAI